MSNALGGLLGASQALAAHEYGPDDAAVAAGVMQPEVSADLRSDGAGLSSDLLTLEAAPSNRQDLDVASAAMSWNTAHAANTAYQAALATIATVQSVSLLDFLK